MKQRFYYLPFIAVLIAVFLLGRKCSNNTPAPTKTDKDSLVKASNAILPRIANDKKDIEILNKIGGKLDSTIEKKHKPNWNKAKEKAKNDSIPCKERIITLISSCDSLVAKLDSLNELNKRIKLKNDSLVARFDTLTANYQKVAKIDSMTIDSLIHSRKKFWKGFKLGLGIGFGAGVIGSGLVK